MWFFGKKAKTSDNREELIEKRHEAEKSRAKELEEHLAADKQRLSELRKKLEELKKIVGNNPGSLAIGEAYKVKTQIDVVNERIKAYETELERVRMITQLET